MRFKEGDTVRYELSWWGKPRWIGNRDRGGSGHWEEGQVIQVADSEIIVEGRTGKSNWPLGNHRLYDSEQWRWSGYLQLVGPIRKEEVQCTCGSASVYGSDTNLHSDWCEAKK